MIVGPRKDRVRKFSVINFAGHSAHLTHSKIASSAKSIQSKLFAIATSPAAKTTLQSPYESHREDDGNRLEKLVS